MPNPFFRFKEFVVYHDRCAMKVGTDGVLLGAWTKVEGKANALDVGVGSGLVSLMLAQRNPSLIVNALEIDIPACEQACENIDNSPFADRISVQLQSLQAYAAGCERRYEAVVSNPPFFSSSLKSPSPSRTVARHNDTLTPEELISCSSALLSPTGSLSLIYPAECLDELLEYGRDHSLFPSRLCRVYPKANVPAKRVLLELAFHAASCVESELTLEIDRHVYTEEFRELTKAFYL
jgi:tRNA1Val (adenine37-N6)-methyltransferase